jgi:DNA-3-methyladenine glycosylase
MFGPPGHAYVYLVYGLHHCLNVVCGPDGEAAAVLIRAAEPVAGLERMRLARGVAAGEDARLAAGPARTCQALGIDRSLSGLDLLTDDRLWIAHDGRDLTVAAQRTVIGPRVGVEYAGPEWAGKPWRFGLAGHPSLSRPFPTPV